VRRDQHLRTRQVLMQVCVAGTTCLKLTGAAARLFHDHLRRTTWQSLPEIHRQLLADVLPTARCCCPSATSVRDQGLSQNRSRKAAP
jgi:hypothetical protein